MTPSTGAARVFLSAEWRDLVMLNYEVAPALLRDFGRSSVWSAFDFCARGFSET
jgi:hypothetical protein